MGSGGACVRHRGRLAFMGGVVAAGVLTMGCNSIVGNDVHHLAPAGGLGGTAGAAAGFAAGGRGGGGGGAVVGRGGAPGATGGAAGAPASGSAGGAGRGGSPATGGSIGNGGGGGSMGGPNGSGGAVGTGGATGTGGTAGAGGMCLAPGGTCAATTDCCQTGSTAPTGAVCISDDNLCHAKCTSGTQCKSGCCASVMGETYGVCADAATYCATLKGVGDPCTADTECASGSCSIWCQAPCGAGNSICSSTPSRLENAQGQLNWCILSNANTTSCFPGCLVDSDCAVFGAGLTCQSVTDVDGLTDSVCSL